jgi:hypothetical protein
VQKEAGGGGAANDKENDIEKHDSTDQNQDGHNTRRRSNKAYYTGLEYYSYAIIRQRTSFLKGTISAWEYPQLDGQLKSGPRADSSSARAQQKSPQLCPSVCPGIFLGDVYGPTNSCVQFVLR